MAVWCLSDATPLGTSIVEGMAGRADQVIVRATRGSRIAAWALFGFGMLFALSGLPQIGVDLSTAITMALAGLVFAAVGGSLATAKVTADERGLTYRHGWTRRVAAHEIRAVEVGPGSGAGYARLAVRVLRQGHRPLRLTALQRADTERSREDLERTAAAIRAALVLPQVADANGP